MDKERRIRSSIPYAFSNVSANFISLKNCNDEETKKKILTEIGNSIELVASNFDWSNLTREKLIASGFANWDTEVPEIGDIYLIPSYLYRHIPSDIKLVTVSGEIVKAGEHLDNDTRGGYLAYGVIAEPPKDPTVVERFQELFNSLF